MPISPPGNIFSILSSFGSLVHVPTKEKVPSAQEINCKFIGLLFTADWCPGCVQLSKVLPSLLRTVDKSGEQFKIITIRMDNSASRFSEHYYKFSSLLPEQAEKLYQVLRISRLPSLQVYNMKGQLVSLDGVQDMQKFRGQTLQLWGSI